MSYSAIFVLVNDLFHVNHLAKAGSIQIRNVFHVNQSASFRWPFPAALLMSLALT